jgi:NhaP-type Na+/H+ or K+/H+ antiporter
LSVLSLTIFAKIIWEKLDRHAGKEKKIETVLMEEIISRNSKSLADTFTKLWKTLFLPILFVLIGNEADFRKINLNILGLDICLIIIGLAIRFIATFVSVFYKKFNFREKIFLCLAWIPKATIQVYFIYECFVS